MRILFSSVGNFGHIHPLLPLARAAREAGHEVRFGTSEQFHPVVRGAGLEPVAAGIPVPAAFLEAAGGQAFLESMGGEVGAADLAPEVLEALGVKAFGSVLPRRIAADLAPVIADWRPGLVVHEVLNPGAGFAARLAGVPALSHGFGRLPADAEEAALQEVLRETAAELGVELPAAHPFTVGHPFLDICPPSLQEPGFLGSGHPRLPLRPVPFDDGGGLPAAARRGDGPLVYLTLGTALGAAPVLRTAVEGLAGLGVRVLVATGPTVPVEALGELPAGVTALPWVPQTRVLGEVDLVVQHGGSGTMLAAFGAGLPQLVLPQGADQFANAELVLASGAGERLLPDALSAEAVTQAAKRLLTDTSYRDAAHGVAREIAALPSPEQVVPSLAEYAC